MPSSPGTGRPWGQLRLRCPPRRQLPGLVLLRIAGAVPEAGRTWQHFPLAQAIREREVVLSLDENGAMIALPMIVRGEVIGSLGWGWAADRSFGDEDRSFLGTLAELCGQALDRARLYAAERAARERAERETEERRRASEAARRIERESEERLRTLSDNLPLGAIYQITGDAEGRRRVVCISAGIEACSASGRRNPGRPRRHVRPGPRGGPCPRGRPGRGSPGPYPLRLRVPLVDSLGRGGAGPRRTPPAPACRPARRSGRGSSSTSRIASRPRRPSTASGPS